MYKKNRTEHYKFSSNHPLGMGQPFTIIRHYSMSMSKYLDRATSEYSTVSADTRLGYGVPRSRIEFENALYENPFQLD